MHIDNLEIIKPLLTFSSDDDFYYLQILQRKKENVLKSSNSRVIKNYYIKSVEHLERRWEEIKALCIQFNARASIRLNKRSFEKVAFKCMENIAHTMMSRDYDFINKAYDRACGQSHNETEKKWILDFDNTDVEYVQSCFSFINSLDPQGENKIIATIPSRSGIHLITKPFRRDLFFGEFPKVEIHQDNPTNLFIPNNQQYGNRKSFSV